MLDPNSVDLNALPAKISDVVWPWAERSPDRIALVELSESWTYGDLASAVTVGADLLTNSGVRPGDRVMIVCENCRAMIALLFAAVSIDAWAVPVSARFTAREIDQIRDHCGARRVLYTLGASPNAKEHARRHGASVENIGTLGSVGIGPLNEEVLPETVDAFAPDRIATLIYTSGSTGLPKGVMLTHRNLLFIAAVSAKIRRLTQDDGMYGVLPLSHVTGLSVTLLGTLLSGATLHVTARFDPNSLVNALRKKQLSVVLGVPGMFALLVECAKSRPGESFIFPSLRIISSSGAPLDPTLRKSVEALFHLPLHNGYGITECSPTIAQPRIDEPQMDMSVGPILPGIEVKLLNANGSPAADGEIGELWVRGPNVMKGYYRSPDETAAAIDPEGWFNTRDLARIEAGNLFIVGRAKELIIRFGFNVYPAEVEAVLNSHPEIARSAVVGKPIVSQSGEEEVIAFAQRVPGSTLNASDLSKFASRSLAPYKRPSHILFLSEMPLTPSGKISKRELTKIEAYQNLQSAGF